MLRWIAALMAALLCAYAGIRMSGRLRARVEMLRGALDAAYAARPYGWPELTDADKRAAEAFVDALSADTRATICERAALAVETLEQRLGEAEAQYQNKGRVYRTLGLLTGAAVAILLL